MTPYWIFLTICVVSTMSMKKDSTGTSARKLDRIMEDLTEQECSGLTKILQAVNERQESENCSSNTETISQTVKPECPTTPGTIASGKKSSKGNKSSTIVLGLLTGILFATLVAVIVGWIVTCIVLKVKLTEKDQQKRTHTEPHQAVPQPTSNMYGGLNHGPSHITPPATNYSSLGPDYETIDEEEILTRRSEQTNRKETARDSSTVEQETDHTYSMLERKCGQTEGLAGAISINENKDRGKTIVATSYEIPLILKE